MSRKAKDCGSAGSGFAGSGFAGCGFAGCGFAGCDLAGCGFAGWDLHTHTWYSDGTLSPSQLVEMATEKGINTLSITDHDGTFGLEEGAAAAEKCGIRFITGVEFSAKLPAPFDDGGTAYMHILGYGFDPQNRELSDRLQEIREQRRRRNDKLRRALEELGYPLTREDIELYPGQDYIGKPNFARALVKKGFASDLTEAFSSERMMAAPSVKAIHREKIHGEEAISLIRGAGGFASLAHPFKVTWFGRREESEETFRTKLELVLAALAGAGLSGMECYYSSHSREQEEFLLRMAEGRELTVTAGSDYHGPGMKKDVELGGVHGV